MKNDFQWSRILPVRILQVCGWLACGLLVGGMLTGCSSGLFDNPDSAPVASIQGGWPTGVGTKMVKDIDPGPGSALDDNPLNRSIASGQRLFFPAMTGPNVGIWFTDGLGDATLVHDFGPNAQAPVPAKCGGSHVVGT